MGLFGTDLGPLSLRAEVEGVRTAFRLEIALQHFHRITESMCYK